MKGWNNKFDHKRLGQYVYGLAVPVFGTTYIVKYVGQASVPDRCFAHEKEAEKIKNNPDITTSNKDKIDLLNYQNKKGNVKIIILAHRIPCGLLNTIENIYRRAAERGALLFEIRDGIIQSSENLTNIAPTHNDMSYNDMEVKAYTAEELDKEYTIKNCISVYQIKQILGTQQEALFIRNNGGIKKFSKGSFLGCWNLNVRRFNHCDWVVICDPTDSDKITNVYNTADIVLYPINNSDLNEPAFVNKDEGRKCLLIDSAEDFTETLLKDLYFDCPKWNETGVNYL